MAIGRVLIDEFLDLSKTHPVLDVRSPGEFAHAHLPGAHSFPLFSDEQRRLVGTAYKQQSRNSAVKMGLDFFGPRMVQMVEAAEKISADADGSTSPHTHKATFLIHCWRGGMRSHAVAWLLDLYGFKVLTLEGGYKAFRRWVMAQFTKPYCFQVIGGFTGSGKTNLLQALGVRGELVIDLEAIAGHKGSAFGGLGQKAQPSQEMFENLLASRLSEASLLGQPIWIEDESQRIGDVNIPSALYAFKQAAPVYFFDVPFKERLEFLVQEYGKYPKEKLLNSIVRIQRRLGLFQAKNAVNYLLEDDFYHCFEILLQYYDKWYAKSLKLNRPVGSAEIMQISCKDVDTKVNLDTLLQQIFKTTI